MENKNFLMTWKFFDNTSFINKDRNCTKDLRRNRVKKTFVTNYLRENAKSVEKLLLPLKKSSKISNIERNVHYSIVGDLLMNETVL